MCQYQALITVAEVGVQVGDHKSLKVVSPVILQTLVISVCALHG